MESISKPVFLLAVWWLLFFWKFLKNPYLLCTSELASTFFPHWLWMGRQLRQGIFPAEDNVFYKYPASISFLSTFHPFHLFTSYLSSFLKNIDNQFKLFNFLILSQYFIGSVLAYQLFSKWCEPLVSLFGAITLVYSAYMIKPQTPASAYTTNWLIGTFLGGWLGGFCFGLSLLGGYFPILIYFLPFIAVIHPVEVSIGLIIALPQLLPFLGYYKKSVRTGSKPDPQEGKVPVRKLSELFLPLSNYNPTNGIHYPEFSMYIGFIPFLFIWFSGSRFWFLLALSILIAVGIIKPLARIPARALYLLTFSIGILATDGLHCLHLPYSILASILFGQAFLLLRNRDIYPSFPFSQWWDRPSRLYSIKRKLSEWPYFSGYLHGRKHSDYVGAFRLREEFK